MTNDETQTDLVFTDDEVQLLSDARTLLTEIAKRCGVQSWAAPSGHAGITDANAADFGRVQALATVAESAIFTTLNWANSHHVRPLTPEQLHNREAAEDDDPNEGIEVPIGPLNPEQERALR